MQRTKLLLSGLFLTAALALGGPVVTAAAQDAGIQVRVYDSHHRDYHNWDDREDRAYRNYQQERHERYLAYEHRKHSYQQHYWNWRHSHPDRD